MKVTAVILHYYPERTENIRTIINALWLGSQKPSRIIVFNNNPKKPLMAGYIRGAIVINSGINFGGRARYPIALLEPSDYYLFIDDDVLPHKDTLKNFVEHASPGCCLGYIGKKVDDGSYRDYPDFRGNSVKKPTDVDLLVGMGMIFSSHEALVKSFETESLLIKEDWDLGREEDIILSMSNKPQVIPCTQDQHFTELDQGGVGYWRQEGHLDLRQNAILKLKELL